MAKTHEFTVARQFNYARVLQPSKSALEQAGKNEQQSRKARIFWKKKDLFF
jgi:hypothetical protein